MGKLETKESACANHESTGSNVAGGIYTIEFVILG
jgi:hypothetical protein